MATPDRPALIERLSDELAGQGALTDPRWRQALRAVPRDLFVPPAGWADPDSDEPGYRIDHDADPDRWWRAVYSDTSIVTEVDDDPIADATTGEGYFSSSVSAPGVVVLFGELLNVQPGDRVLEVGTGSGWTACLLAHVAGRRGAVTSLEIDAYLSDRAARTIKAADLPGLAPIQLLVADAAQVGTGQLGGPYDRLHVSCGVTEIPWSWIAALRVGGTGVLPWCPPPGAAGSRVRLTRTSPDEATGTLISSAGYMLLRSQRPERGARSDFLHHYGQRATRTTTIDPRVLVRPGTADVGSYGADVAIAAQVPGVRVELCQATDGSGEASLWLRESHHGAREHGSWALAEYVPGAGAYVVHSYGPRDLWDEVSTAWLRWCSWGRPDRARFGLTITPAGQRFWLDLPARII